MLRTKSNDLMNKIFINDVHVHVYMYVFHVIEATCANLRISIIYPLFLFVCLSVLLLASLNSFEKLQAIAVMVYSINKYRNSFVLSA